MLRAIAFPIATGLLLGAGIRLYRDKQYERAHPIKSIFVRRRAA